MSNLPSDLRPSKHAFDPDPLTHGGTCAECGEPFEGLHPQPDVAVDGYELPPVCPECSHFAHDRECPVGFGQGRFAVPCACRVRKAAVA